MFLSTSELGRFLNRLIDQTQFHFILIPHKAFSIKTVAGLVILDILCEKENIVIVLK